MNISRRLVIVVFFVLVILFVGLLFWPFILSQIIKPIAQIIWILLRIFVLSIDQKYYWWAVVFITSLLLYRHLAPPPHSTIQSEDDQDSNATMETLGRWRSLFSFFDRNIQEDSILRENLVRLLLSLYAIKQHISADFRLHDALQKGAIPIPEQIHAVLFPEEPQPAGYSFKKLIQSIGNIPRKWIRHWTGQETAEHYRVLDKILCFMETSLEMKNDDGIFNPPQH